MKNNDHMLKVNVTVTLQIKEFKIQIDVCWIYLTNFIKSALQRDETDARHEATAGLLPECQNGNLKYYNNK